MLMMTMMMIMMMMMMARVMMTIVGSCDPIVTVICSLANMPLTLRSAKIATELGDHLIYSLAIATTTVVLVAREFVQTLG